MTTEPPRFSGPPVDAAVLACATAPPAVPAEPVVDVRPGHVATFDGDRHRLPLRVGRGADARVVGATAPAALEVAVASRLAPGGVVRFGDRRTCRRLLPRLSADAVERRLARVAAEAEATLLTWTSGRPGPADRRRYANVPASPQREAATDRPSG